MTVHQLPGHKLRDHRKRRLHTQEELAELVGASTMTIRRWESGQSRPQPALLRRLCEVLEATPTQLGFPPENAPVKRREFLKHGLVLGTAAVGDQERLADALLYPAHVDQRLLNDLSVMTRGFAAQAQTVTPRVLLVSMTAHLGRLRLLAEEGSYPTSTR